MTLTPTRCIAGAVLSLLLLGVLYAMKAPTWCLLASLGCYALWLALALALWGGGVPR